MKAIVYERYGPPDVLELRDIPTPVPKDNEVLVRVVAASVNAYDWHLLRAKPFLVRFMTGFFSPGLTVAGADFAGIVESTGGSGSQFRAGDEVFGCRQGSFAEFLSVPEHRLTHKPPNVSFEHAAAAPMAGLTALQALRNEGKIRTGQRVLINGAGGGVGTFAVQLAKSFGAEVTAVCSARNTAMARSIGADHVIDYASTDFTREPQRYDLIIGANGYHSLVAYKRALNNGGIYVMTGGSNSQMFQASLGSLVALRSGKTLTGTRAAIIKEDLEYIAGLLASGVVSPVIDRRYPLTAAADAIRYIEEGHACGKVIVTVAPVSLS